MTQHLYFSERGFTLLELLVAIAIFAVLAAMAYGGLNTVLSTSRYASIQVERLTKIQTAVATISRDLIQRVNRPIRDEYGDRQQSFLGGGGKQGIEFTRGGRRNPAGFPRSSLQRIGYTIQDGWLLRLSWRVLDRAQDSAPISQPLLDRVDGVIFRFLDNAGVWHDQWPPEKTPQPVSPPSPFPARNLLLAVEVNLDIQNFGRITRLYPLNQ